MGYTQPSSMSDALNFMVDRTMSFDPDRRALYDKAVSAVDAWSNPRGIQRYEKTTEVLLSEARSAVKAAREGDAWVDLKGFEGDDDALRASRMFSTDGKPQFSKETAARVNTWYNGDIFRDKDTSPEEMQKYIDENSIKQPPIEAPVTPETSSFVGAQGFKEAPSKAAASQASQAARGGSGTGPGGQNTTMLTSGGIAGVDPQSLELGRRTLLGG